MNAKEELGKDRVHTIRYLGRYHLNASRLKDFKGQIDNYKRIDENGKEWELQTPPKKVDGIIFGDMEKGKEGLSEADRYYAVCVGNTILQNPICLNSDLHIDGKGFGPQSTQFGDESAERLLVDIIKANPEQRGELEEIYSRYFGKLLETSGFILGAKYSRKDIFKILGIPEDTWGGVWFTGYTAYKGAFYIFTNIDSPGRTGHDYHNHWEGADLRWFAKTGTSLSQPTIKKLLTAGTPVHIFWRTDNTLPFEYAGKAFPIEIRDTSPVEILWSFSNTPPAPIRPINYWAFLANPNRYRISDAIKQLEQDLWTVGDSKVVPGDRILIWQSLDGDEKRGIVSLGEVVSSPQLIKDQGNPFWVNPSDGATEEMRVLVRYLPSPALPIWIGQSNHDDFLRSLTVARARGGSVFHLTPSDWEALMAILGGWQPTISEATETEQRGGQGRGLSRDQIKAVEKYAMDRAKEFFGSKWDAVIDVSAKNPYDLHCIRPKEELHVEVKGTTGTRLSIILTKNEVLETKKARCALYIVNDIKLETTDDGHFIGSGGTEWVIDPWFAEEHQLTPTQFDCVLERTKAKKVIIQVKQS